MVLSYDTRVVNEVRLKGVRTLLTMGVTFVVGFLPWVKFLHDSVTWARHSGGPSHSPVTCVEGVITVIPTGCISSEAGSRWVECQDFARVNSAHTVAVLN